MRFFCTLVLIGSGCGFGDDHAVVEPASPDMDMEDEMGEIGDPVVPLIADVCDQRTWDIPADTKQLDLAVVQTAAGATVFGVPKDGGAVRGFRVDQRADLFDRDMIPIRDDRNYTGVSASTAGGRLIVASVIDDKVALDVVRDDLGARFALGDFSGSLVTDAPITTSRETQVALVGGSFGLTGHAFTGAAWEASAPIDLTKAPIVSMTATAYLDDAMVAWSTSTKECHLQRFASRKESVREFGCDGVRIAVNPAADSGMLVYEENGLVYRTDIRVGAESELANKVRLAEVASSPRVAFDGSRYWISYVDGHGDVVVGFVDDKGRLNSRALEGTRPDVGDAYDLAVFSGGVWVVGVSDLAFGAQRICAVPQP